MALPNLCLESCSCVLSCAILHGRNHHQHAGAKCQREKVLHSYQKAMPWTRSFPEKRSCTCFEDFMLMESFNILCKSPNVFEGVSKVQFAILEVEAKRLLIKFYYGIAYLYAEIIWSAVDQLIMEKALWSICN